MAAFRIRGGGVFTLLFSLGTWLARRPLLGFLPAPTPGPTPRATFCGWWRWTRAHHGQLWRWVIAAQRGPRRQASAGMMFGASSTCAGPVFIFVFQAERGGGHGHRVFHAARWCFSWSVPAAAGTDGGQPHPVLHLPFTRQVFSVGLASALATAQGNAPTWYGASGLGLCPSRWPYGKRSTSSP